jgi:flagellin
MISVNNNYGAAIALQSLNSTNKQLDEVQNRINTGLKVSSAKDSGAVFAIAQGQRARVSALASVQDGINRVSNVIDAGLAAGNSVSNLLSQLKTQAAAAMSEDLSTTQRQAYADEFNNIRASINGQLSAATINGANLVDGTNTANGIKVLQSDLTNATGGGNVATVKNTAKPATTVTPQASDLVINASEAWATGNDLVANDYLRIAVTDVASGTVTNYAIQITATTTIQNLVDSVNASTGGKIIANYNASNGDLTFQASAAVATTSFTIATNNAATGTGTARTSTFIGAATSTDQADVRPSNQTLISGYDFRVGGSGALSSLATLNIAGATTTGANAAYTALGTMIDTLNSQLSTLGSKAKALDTQNEFLTKLTDTLNAGISNLVDADLAKESARLQSLQIKQQLGAQALSIANQAPSLLLSFFR